MARTTEVIAIETRRKYHWPEAQLNLWMLVMLAASASELGFFTFFYTNQVQLELGIPWLFPYQITVASVSLVFLTIMLWLISQRQLLPGVVIVGSFMCFVLWVTGLVELGIQLFGPTNSVNSVCNTYVNSMQYVGLSIDTLAWITQKNICNCWEAGFAFQFVGTLFLLWMMIMSYQVNNDDF